MMLAYTVPIYVTFTCVNDNKMTNDNDNDNKNRSKWKCIILQCDTLSKLWKDLWAFQIISFLQ